MDLRKLSLANFKKMDKKLIRTLLMFIVIIIVIVVAIITVKLISGNRTSYQNIEDMMVKAAKKYYSEDESGINSFKSISNGTISVSAETLIEKEYLKEFDKIIPDKGENMSCSGKVIVKMNNDYILYSPELNCTNYKTQKLSQVISTVTVESGDGLYQQNEEFIFRGEKVNNYLSFAGKTWLIMRINTDGNIRVIETTNREKIKWDDRYNSEVKGNSGINNFHVSRIKDALIELYENDDEFSDEDRSYIVPQNLCIGKRNEKETNNSGSVECSNVVENWMIGLIQVNEYLNVSLDTNCQTSRNPQCGNYNYLKQLRNSYWSITTDTERTDKAYKMTPGATLNIASNLGSIRAVILLDKDSVYVKGDGSEANPYVFK